MKQLLMCVIPVLFVVAPSVLGGADVPVRPGEHDLVFELTGGLSLGYRDDIDHFVSILGDPLRRDERVHPYGGFVMEMMEFDGITVLFLAQTGNVYAIWVSDPRIKTARGIRVGDPISAVLAAYGEPFHRSGADRLDFEVFNDDRDAGLTFLLNDGVVVEILIAATW